ncbi:MAG: 50S ribosomal protein L18e [Candidatus Diapherotrites archaeon]
MKFVRDGFMNKKSNTKELVGALRKKAIADKQKIWKKIADSIEAPSRIMPVVNLAKLENLGKKYNGMTFVVPGKVLGDGDLQTPIKVIAFSISKTAKQKILDSGGSFQYLVEIIDKKIDGKELIIVK